MATKKHTPDQVIDTAADRPDRTELVIETNTGCELHFRDAAEVLEFVQKNSERVSVTLELLTKAAKGKDGMQDVAMEGMIDLAFQVSQAALLIGAAREVPHG